MNQLIEVLDRQQRFLITREGGDFLAQLPEYVGFLRREPQIDVHIDDLVRDAIDALRRYEAQDESTVAELKKLRRTLVRAAPEIDDSTIDEPDPASSDYHLFHFSLARFDRQAEAEAVISFPDSRSATSDPARSGGLIELLRVKIDQAEYGKSDPLATDKKIRSDLDHLRLRLVTLADRHQHAYRLFLLESRTLAGVSIARLERVASSLIVEVPKFESMPARLEWLSTLFMHDFATGASSLRAALFNSQLDDTGLRQVETSVAELKFEAERTYEALRARIGSQLSHRGVVERFRARCQIYRASELRDLAVNSATPEDDLALQLAYHLFDQGFNPLVKPLVGGLQPDLLDPSVTPWTMYVEAKQYGRTGRSGRRAVISASRQIWDTLGRLRGSGYDVHEAFLVVFRLGGPRLALPDAVEAEGVTLWPLLVSSAAEKCTGFRSRKVHHRVDVVAAGQAESRSDGA
jgi:hypothetical protein